MARLAGGTYFYFQEQWVFTQKQSKQYLLAYNTYVHAFSKFKVLREVLKYRIHDSKHGMRVQNIFIIRMTLKGRCPTLTRLASAEIKQVPEPLFQQTK
jgi:hypothetical protein